MRRLELEKEKLAQEEREKEQEKRFKLEEKKLQAELEVKKLEIDRLRPTHESFDVTKHIRLVLPIQEADADKYFLHFEKIAENLKWPKESWTILLQSVLVGKARDVYTQLTLKQASRYEEVKQLIMKGYELVPEAYRQNFRNCCKESNQTYMEFARTK